MSKIHQPVVAGMFYPGESNELRSTVLDLLAAAAKDHPIPKAIIVPHAGFVYSGPIAASAYACLQKQNKINKVVVLAPAHRYPFMGIATSDADYFVTPLGNIEVSKDALNFSEIQIIDMAFRQEHSLEVQLPFLQVVLTEFKLIPLIIGQSSPEQVASVLELLWDDDETLIVVSSDLSHYHDYITAQELDQKTAQAILNLDITAFAGENACGHLPIKGLLEVVKKKGLKPSLIDLRNSGDTAGEKGQVVGYGAFHFGKNP